ncbi:hypothetical protein M5D96_012118, partial [Drosophila gunungcola]
DKDQRHWDKHLSRISCTLLSGYHEALGLESYYAMFGTKHTRTRAHEKAERTYITRSKEIEFAVGQVVYRKNYKQSSRIEEYSTRAHEKAERTYITRSKEIEFAVGQVVYRKNYKQSSRIEEYNAKLGPNRVRCLILGRKGG